MRSAGSPDPDPAARAGPARPAPRAGQPRVFGQKPPRIALRNRHQGRPAVQIRDSEPRQARLRGADQIARAAHRQILFGDAEAVFGIAQGRQAPLPRLVQRRPDTSAGRSIAPHPAPPGRATGATAPDRRSRRRSITMIVALGTSTPTSITVVATRTDVSPATKRAMAASLSAGRHLAMDQPDLVARKPRADAGSAPRHWRDRAFQSPPPAGRPNRPAAPRPPPSQMGHHLVDALRR